MVLQPAHSIPIPALESGDSVSEAERRSLNLC